MARSEPDPPLELDPLKGGLKHHPFAALKAKIADTPAAPETRASNPAPAPTPAPEVSRERVSVRHERTGRGGKTVTIADGPGLAGRDLAELAGEIARALGTGARAEGASLVVQGDQRERLADWLAAHGFAAVAQGT